MSTSLLQDVPKALAELGARQWQIDLVTPLLVDAIIRGELEPEVEPAPEPDPEPDAGE